jgi:hypothetical protein
VRKILTSSLAFAAVFGTAHAAASNTPTELTVYHSDDAALFSAGDNGGTPSGYAMVREPRLLDLKAGNQDISLGGLPMYLDSETLALGFDDDDARVLSQQLQLGQGGNALLGSLVGQPVEVIGSNGQTLASGILTASGDNLLVRGSDGRSSLIHDYAAVRASGAIDPGARLDLRIQANRAGHGTAHLSYVTAGLGWRAAYVGTLQPGGACRLQFESRASVANRSGRDWKNAALTLIAGQPNTTRTSAPRPMMMKAMAASADAMPQQSSLADYRSYRLPAAVSLPDGSVSQLPLYATRTIDCERTALYENGSTYAFNRPMIDPGFSPGSNESVTSTLKLRAFDNLPAGNLRVLAADTRGVPQFIGEGRIEDTPKGSDAQLTLGTAFDLRGARERTAFHVDQAGRTLDEAFRITLSNAGDNARVITVREHPSRWHEWKLASSSSKPSQQSPDTITFRVSVPAGGETRLDYAVHYTWTADAQPQ